MVILRCCRKCHILHLEVAEPLDSLCTLLNGIYFVEHNIKCCVTSKDGWIVFEDTDCISDRVNSMVDFATAGYVQLLICSGCLQLLEILEISWKFVQLNL